MCIYVCTECRTVCGDPYMPDEIRKAGMGEQLVYMATHATGPLTCLNPKCENYKRIGDWESEGGQ